MCGTVGLFVLAASIGALAQNRTSDRLEDLAGRSMPIRHKPQLVRMRFEGTWSLQLRETQARRIFPLP